MGSATQRAGHDGRQRNTVCECCEAPGMELVDDTAGGNYRKCGVCGHESQDSLLPATDQFESAQREHFGDSSMCLGTAMHVLERERIVERLRVISKYLPAGSIVEIGPGSGNTAQALTDRGYELALVEHSPVLGEAIRERLGLETWVGEFEQIDFGERTFDAYASFHVLEHVADENAHLAKEASMVRPEGYAFIATPNAGSAEHRVLGRHSPNYSSAHLRLFTAESLERALLASGWKLVELLTPSYTDAHLRVATASLRAIRGGTRAAGEPQPRASYAGAVASRPGQLALSAARVLTWPLRAVQYRAGMGNELMIVARRA